MRPMLTTAALLGSVLLAQGALAQTQPARPGNPPAAAPATPAAPTGDRSEARPDDGPQIVAMTALENGANSFTEGQARSRFEAAGFTGVEALRKDDNGIWRGRGMRSGAAVELAMDFRGRIATGAGPMPGASMPAPAATPPAAAPAPATPAPATPAPATPSR
ncbi:hypothetical protein [Neoroseomonas terrae]|jgi:protein CpxP|uniref:hypothetical protein n=1 Tax=Neoroseomonas terrae TaxID=424799 RepID=UPI001BA4E003|nr:hypothetical protein [Neoroseomonas terrae]